MIVAVLEVEQIMNDAKSIRRVQLPVGRRSVNPKTKNDAIRSA